jgi:hypothetical protein
LPDEVPARSDVVLVSTTRYKGDGDANAAIDPMGVETRWENDAKGRRIRLIENYKASPSPEEPDANRITEYGYAPDGGMNRLVLRNAITGDQVTEWIYGTTLEDSEIATSHLLKSKIYRPQTL